MKFAYVIGTLALVASFVGCSNDDPQKVEPASRGQRGETCLARNDCQSGLACIEGVCSQNDFDVEVAAKHCDQIDCQDTADCCGDRPTEAPAECANLQDICFNPSLPGCFLQSCTGDAGCGDGTCGAGYCSNDTTKECTEDGQCGDTCADDGYCTLSTFTTCDEDSDCAGACVGRICDCTNPEYDPTNEICTTTICDDVCILTCAEERCVLDTSCETNEECLSLGLPLCDDGKCVECESDDDCDEEGDSCVSGICKAGCSQNEECPFFHACQEGECVPTGCSSDRECILAANAVNGGSGDPRLMRCLPSDENPDIKTCKIPCENDGECGSFEACSAGFCVFVGCETDEECRGYLGLGNEEVSSEQPFIPRAVCRE